MVRYEFFKNPGLIEEFGVLKKKGHIGLPLALPSSSGLHNTPTPTAYSTPTPKSKPIPKSAPSLNLKPIQDKIKIRQEKEKTKQVD